MITYHSVQDVLDLCDKLKLPFWKVIMQADCEERQVSEKECFDLLCRSYIESRYNKDFGISQEQLEYLISRVDILRDVTERLCKEKIAEYDTMTESVDTIV